MRKPLLIPLFSLFFLFLTIPVFAVEGEVNIMAVPQRAGEMLGVPEPNTAFVGGLFMSMMLFLTLIMPMLLLRNKAPAMIMIFLVLAFEVAVTWLPVYVFIVILILISALFSGKIKRIFR